MSTAPYLEEKSSQKNELPVDLPCGTVQNKQTNTFYSAACLIASITRVWAVSFGLISALQMLLQLIMFS